MQTNEKYELPIQALLFQQPQLKHSFLDLPFKAYKPRWKDFGESLRQLLVFLSLFVSQLTTHRVMPQFQSLNCAQQPRANATPTTVTWYSH